MGAGASKEREGGGRKGEEGERVEEEEEAQDGGQLYVSLKMDKNRNLAGELVPHVFGSLPLIGSWDSSKAVIFVT